MTWDKYKNSPRNIPEWDFKGFPPVSVKTKTTSIQIGAVLYEIFLFVYRENNNHSLWHIWYDLLRAEPVESVNHCHINRGP